MIDSQSEIRKAGTVIFHIGVMKAASTTLQDFFSKHSEISSYGRPFVNEDQRHLFTSILTKDRYELDFLDVRNKIYSFQSEKPNSRCSIISDEKLSSSAWPSEIAFRLHQICPDAKILVVLRNQLDAITSFYFAHGKRPSGNIPISTMNTYVPFSEWIEDNLYRMETDQYHKLDHQYFKSLDYCRLLSPFIKFFGVSNIRVALFEELRESPYGFYKSICEWLGISYLQFERTSELIHKNQRPSELKFKYDIIRSKLPLKGISRFVPFGEKIKNNAFRLSGKTQGADIELNANQIARVKHLYADSNSWVDNKFNLSMAANGYLLANNDGKSSQSQLT